MGRGAGQDHVAEHIRRERRGGEGALSAEEFGMVSLPNAEVPDGYDHTHGWYGVNESGEEDWEEFWGSWPVVEIGPEVTLYTGQQHVSATALARGDMEDEDLPLLVLVDGQHWIIDGHHRLASARQQGLAQEVRLADYEQAVKDGSFDVLLEAFEEADVDGE